MGRQESDALQIGISERLGHRGISDSTNDPGSSISSMLARLSAWLRRRRHEHPPEDLDTPEELDAREEGRRLLDDKDTYRALGRSGPDATSGTWRDAGR